MNEVNELIKVIREVSPVIWHAAVRESYIEGTLFCMLAVIFMAIGGFLVKKFEEEAAFVGLILIIFSLILFAFGAANLLNPTYWAFVGIKP